MIDTMHWMYMLYVHLLRGRALHDPGLGPVLPNSLTPTDVNHEIERGKYLQPQYRSTYIYLARPGTALAPEEGLVSMRPDAF